MEGTIEEVEGGGGAKEALSGRSPGKVEKRRRKKSDENEQSDSENVLNKMEKVKKKKKATRGENNTKDNNVPLDQIQNITNMDIDNIIGVPHQQPSSSTNTNEQHTLHTNTQKHITSNTATHAQTLNMNTINENNCYKDGDKAPFVIFMEKPDINEIEVAKYLVKANITGIKEIRKLYKGKLKIVTHTMAAANGILQCKILKSMQNINSYIPSQCVKSVGIIRGIPLDITNEEISEYLESPVRVDSFERMTYWDKVNKCSKPGTSIKITFRTTTLPDEVKMFYVVKKVSHFIPRPILCRNCLRYGHTAKFCKVSKETLCNNCTGITHSFNDASCNKTCEHCLLHCQPKCKHCTKDDNHRTASKDCPELANQMKIKELMVVKKVSYKDAKNVVQNNTKENVTYANVTNLINLNNTIMERMKATEDLLKNIIEIKNYEPADDDNDMDTNEIRLRSITASIVNHFKKYKISHIDSDFESDDTILQV